MDNLQQLISFFVAIHCFGLLYHALLKDLKAPEIRRVYLLLSPLIAWLLTYLYLPQTTGFIPENFHINLTEYQVGKNTGSPLGAQIWKDLIYLPTLAIGLFYIVGIARLVHLRISGTIGHVQGKRVILHPQIKSAFTFFWVFIPDPNCDALIVEHEELHQRRLHSLDNLIMALLLSVLWWNPVLWFFSRWIKETHELEVDEILDQKDNSYREVLIKNALLKWNLPLAQPFALKSQIINRIAMMKKERKMKSAWTRAIWITGVTAMITLLVNTACSEKETAQEAQQLTPVENQVKGDQSLVEMKDLDVNPEFPGGNLALSEYLGNEIKYPKAVEADQLEGTVFVEFVVDKTGKVRDAKVKKGFATEADEEALRVISNMPNWEPGKKDGEPVSVAYTIPIKFSF